MTDAQEIALLLPCGGAQDARCVGLVVQATITRVACRDSTKSWASRPRCAVLCGVALASSSTSKLSGQSAYSCEHARSFSTNVNAVGVEVCVTVCVCA